MAAGAHLVVDAVPSRIPSAGISLVEVALDGTPLGVEIVNGERVDRWGNGVKWRPYTDGGVGGAYDPCNATAMSPGTLLGVQTGDVFAIWEAESCSAMGEERFIAMERAKTLLEATTSKKIAAELWRGTISQAAGWSNRRLNNPTAAGNLGQINGAAAVNRVAAFAALEQALGEQGSGAQGYIHCTRRTASFWVSDHLIRRVGNRLVSELGTVIIADAGYDGSASNGSFTTNGTTNWAFATGPIRVFVSDIEVQGGGQVNIVPDISTSGGPIGETLVRTTDLITVRAYRYALAVFDASTHVGVLVDHTNTTTNNAQTT